MLGNIRYITAAELGGEYSRLLSVFMMLHRTSASCSLKYTHFTPTENRVNDTKRDIIRAVM